MNDLTKYKSIAAQMQPGDVIAFAGKEVISYLIDFFSGSSISHVGMVKYTIDADHPDVILTESTIEKGVSGPQDHPLGDVLANYGDGARAWWLPLAPTIRRLIDWQAFYAFVKDAESGAYSYDVPGLFGFLGRQIPILGTYICQSESAKRIFCSGYDTAILEHAGILRGINYTQESPKQLCQIKIFRTDPAPGYVQLMGAPQEIPGYSIL